MTDAPKDRFIFRFNIGGNAVYNWWSPAGMGDLSLVLFTQPYDISSNGFVASVSSMLPSGSKRVPTKVDILFTDLANGDYSLQPGSPFAGMGVDYNTLKQKLQGVR